MLSMQSGDSSGGTGMTKQEYVETVIIDIESKVPEVFDEFNIRKEIGVPSPTQVVLLQEIERFDILVLEMSSSLSSLKRAYSGEIGMSAELDDLSTSLYNGFIPDNWRRKTSQTLKCLSSWMLHFTRRYEQYKFWINTEEPMVIWLSGLHIPES